MLTDENLIKIERYLVKPKNKANLKKRATSYQGDVLDKATAADLLEQGRAHLAELQSKLYAHNKHGVLIILQAMDAAGKDGTIKHIMSGLNPQGVKVHSFKAPSQNELDHNYMWRHYIALPARGEIAIHNRSHYENVLVTRVHPEYILGEQLPQINSVEDIDDKFWAARYAQINRMEQNIAENGTLVLKFFLNVSKDEQKRRFLERIDAPEKNWKFSMADVRERQHWDAYQAAYEAAISATSTTAAPWYVIPADDKWFARLAIAAIIYRRMAELAPEYPTLSKEAQSQLQGAKATLLAEDQNFEYSQPEEKKSDKATAKAKEKKQGSKKAKK
jgi:PPK2 family polyphosphate:nucleotide phosphotransferase